MIKNQHCLFKITCKSLIELLNKYELRDSAKGNEEKSWITPFDAIACNKRIISISISKLPVDFKSVYF